VRRLPEAPPEGPARGCARKKLREEVLASDARAPSYYETLKATIGVTELRPGLARARGRAAAMLRQLAEALHDRIAHEARGREPARLVPV